MMDKYKQPGIQCDGVILVEEEFWRNYDVPNDSRIDFNLEVANSINSNDEHVIEIQATLKLIYNDKEYLNLKNKFIGFFSTVEGEENMDIEEFIEYNAVALMIPYIREHISSITMKSGINPIIIPPINVHALFSE